MFFFFFYFFFNETATTEIYTLSLHDALPIYIHIDPGQQWIHDVQAFRVGMVLNFAEENGHTDMAGGDRMKKTPAEHENE